MITDQDVKKLKQTFATKEDLKDMATKDDLKAFVTKDDLKAELERFATKDDLNKKTEEIGKTIIEAISNEIQTVIEMLAI